MSGGLGTLREASSQSRTPAAVSLLHGRGLDAVSGVPCLPHSVSASLRLG